VQPSAPESQPPTANQSPAETEKPEVPTKKPRGKQTAAEQTKTNVPHSAQDIPLQAVPTDKGRKGRGFKEPSNQTVREDENRQALSLLNLVTRTHNVPKTKSDSKAASSEKNAAPVPDSSHIDAAFESMITGSKSKKLQDARRPGRR
jgi:hypothetical protein